MSNRTADVKLLYLTPVQFFKVNDRIAAFVGVNDPESDRAITLRAISDVLGDSKAKEIRNWLEAGDMVVFEVVLR